MPTARPAPPRIAALTALWLAAAVFGVVVAPADAAAASSAVGRSVHRQGSRTLPELLRSELDAAKRQRQGVVIMFTADWCAPCKDVKRFVAGSAVVRKALTRGRMLYIDVDEWRGPAQRLIPGVDAAKLPTLVRVGDAGESLRTCFGTDLGLLSEDAVAHNLTRLLAGQAPEKPFYADKPEVERELMRKHAGAQAALTRGVLPLQVTAAAARDDEPDDVRRIQLVIRNNDGPRRWFLIPKRADAVLSEKPVVRAWQGVRWTEHVRADFFRFAGSPDFVAVPVAGYGAVTLEDWPLPGNPRDGKLHVWELDRLAIDGQDQVFQMKLPYELRVTHPEQQAVAREGKEAKVEMQVRTRHQVALPR